MDWTNIGISLKRPLVWLFRFRHRCGYGVHSPFAFNLITQVIYERAAYYEYSTLAQEQKALKPSKNPEWGYESLKVKRLLFRLVNYAQPHTVVDVGRLSASALYLKAAKRDMDYVGATDTTELFLESGVPVDFLYLHDYRSPELVEKVLQVCLNRTADSSLFVIEGVGYTRRMHELWKRLQQDERVGITFDLYDLGLLFFDRGKIKQDYIVNF